MFGNLLGTLQRFRQDETRVKDREMKKREIEKKIDEKTEKEREEAIKQKKELFSEREKQQHGIKVLQVPYKFSLHLSTMCFFALTSSFGDPHSMFPSSFQIQMKRVEEFELWEKNKRRQMSSIRTSASPRLFFLPKEHNDQTMTSLEETMEAIENEITEARDKFEEDLLKIEAKVTNQSKVKNALLQKPEPHIFKGKFLFPRLVVLNSVPLNCIN